MMRQIFKFLMVVTSMVMVLPAPMCVSLLDSLNGAAPHVQQRINLAVVVAGPIELAAAVAKARDWQNLRLLATAGTDYNRRYHGEAPDGRQMPMCNIFVASDDGIRHFWGSELLYAVTEGQPRHMDMLWPIWNVFDLTPDGRGTDWYPKITYDST